MKSDRVKREKWREEKRKEKKRKEEKRREEKRKCERELLIGQSEGEQREEQETKWSQSFEWIVVIT